MKKIIFTSISLFIFLVCAAQQPAADTVVVELAKSSKLMLTIHDREDIELLRHYDFQGLFDDILSQLEEEDDVDAEEIENEEMDEAGDLDIDEDGDYIGDGSETGDD